MTLTSCPFFYILINGVLSPTFKPSRGIRQGHPLSPFIFIFMIDGFSCLIQATSHSNKKIYLCFQNHEIKHTHQEFLDGTLAMGHPLDKEAKAFKQALKYFMVSFGTSINEAKY